MLNKGIMKKVAVVIHRYSIEISGGIEVHAKLLTEHLAERYDVEVLTTTVKDVFIENFYPEGDEITNGIKVKRFKVESKFGRKIGSYLRRNQRYKRRKLSLTNFFYLPILRFIYRKRKDYDQLLEQWMQIQGFYSPDLLQYINDNKDKYTAFIFLTYLFYPAYKGLQSVGYKSIFIPTAHDEVFFHFYGMERVFNAPKFIMYNTLSEKELVESNYPQTKNIKSDIAGVGFDKQNFTPQPISVDSKYFVYIGRINKGKGCKELINSFLEYKQKCKSDLKLVMIGSNHLRDIEASDDVIFTGFVTEDEKLTYLQNSEALIVASHFESLSMVTLEAMLMGKPVLVTGENDVLRQHIEVSKAGYSYYGQKDFNKKINLILNLSDIEKDELAKNGIKYVEDNYNWKSIIAKFDRAISYIEETTK